MQCLCILDVAARFERVFRFLLVVCWSVFRGRSFSAFADEANSCWFLSLSWLHSLLTECPRRAGTWRHCAGFSMTSRRFPHSRRLAVVQPDTNYTLADLSKADPTVDPVSPAVCLKLLSWIWELASVALPMSDTAMDTVICYQFWQGERYVS